MIEVGDRVKLKQSIYKGDHLVPGKLGTVVEINNGYFEVQLDENPVDDQAEFWPFEHKELEVIV